MPRRADIDLAKGVAIVLVVFGHLVARADPAQVGWYEPMRRAIYSFHMPFFLYLSGLVAACSGSLMLPRAAWGRVARARARRLLVPFFGLGLCILLGKLALAPHLFIDNAPAGLWCGLDGLLLHTARSPAASIWYLFVLFVVSTASMASLGGHAARLPWLLAGCVLLYALPLPAICYLDRIGGYALFFALGAGAGMLGETWDALIDRAWPALLAIFLILLGLDMRLGADWPEKCSLLVIGALSMPALHGWLRYSMASWPRAFTLLGRYSFMIYLFNTLCIGFAKAILLRFCAWDGAHFPLFACALMAAGLLGPLALKWGVFRYIPSMDRLTD
jgi:fucose 4-O-acetylase-like acetyltransferase